MMNEAFPEFFKQVPTIVTYDPLAQILGTVTDGIIKFRYIQVVKAAGHSCPTVAGAFLLTRKALELLYGDALPVRGNIKVEFKESMKEGVAGVMANVASHITGAASEGGFKGLGGRFARHSLLYFDADISSMVRFTRIDTEQSVELNYDANLVPPSQELRALMPLIAAQTASKEQLLEFGTLWQERVKSILIDNPDRVITVL